MKEIVEKIILVHIQSVIEKTICVVGKINFDKDINRLSLDFSNCSIFIKHGYILINLEGENSTYETIEDVLNYLGINKIHGDLSLN